MIECLDCLDGFGLGMLFFLFIVCIVGYFYVTSRLLAYVHNKEYWFFGKTYNYSKPEYFIGSVMLHFVIGRVIGVIIFIITGIYNIIDCL